MKYLVVQRFDDGSKKEGPKSGKSANYEVGEIYQGPNAKELLSQGLIAEEKAKDPKDKGGEKPGEEKGK